MRIEIETSVPKEEVEGLMAIAKADGATSSVCEERDDGTYTLTFSYPETSTEVK